MFSDQARHHENLTVPIQRGTPLVFRHAVSTLINRERHQCGTWTSVHRAICRVARRRVRLSFFRCFKMLVWCLSNRGCQVKNTTEHAGKLRCALLGAARAVALVIRSCSLAHPPWVTLAFLIVAQSSDAEAKSALCRNGQKPSQVVQLLFGRGYGDDAGVTEPDWISFVSRELTPRFPDGLTIINSAGQWRDPGKNTTIREASKVVEIVLPGRNSDALKINAVVEAYKLQFHQQSVGLIVEAACVRF